MKGSWLGLEGGASHFWERPQGSGQQLAAHRPKLARLQLYLAHQINFSKSDLKDIPKNKALGVMNP